MTSALKSHSKLRGMRVFAALLLCSAWSTAALAVPTDVLVGGVHYTVDIPVGATQITLNNKIYLIDNVVYTDPAYLPGGLFYQNGYIVGRTGEQSLTHIASCVSTSANTTRCSVAVGVITLSTTDRLNFNAPTQTTTNATNYATTLNAKIIGGTLLYNQTFAAAYADQTVQAGVAQARLALTTAGGPGVVITAPILISHSVNATSTVEGTLYTLNHSTGPVYVATESVGPATVVTGDINNCAAAVAALPSRTAPICKANTNTYTLDFAAVLTNADSSSTYFIDQAQTVTATTTIAETYLIQGVVKPIGVIHAVAPVAVFDQSEGFLARGLARADSRGSTHWQPWLEYWGHANSTRGLGTSPGDTRRSSGIDGGIIYQVSPGFTLGAGIDHGTTNLALSDGSESGRLKLTQGAVFARLGATHGLSLLLGGGIGGGSVHTSVSIPTITQASTANEQVRSAWAGAEVSDRIGVARGRAIITPLAGIGYSSIKLNGFTEAGSTYAVAGPRSTQSRTREWAGINAEIPVTTRLSLSVGAKAVHYDGDTAPSRVVSFVNYPTITGLAVTAPVTNRWGGDMTAGAAFQIVPHLTLFANGSLLAQDGNTDRALRVGVSSSF